MPLLNLICQDNLTIEAELDRFIADYDTMPDEKRIKSISAILELLHHALDNKLNHLLPVAESKPTLAEIVAESDTHYEAIENVMEKMINIHVDEPDNQFKELSIELRALFHQQFYLEQETLLPRLEPLLTLEEHVTLGKYLNNCSLPLQPVSANAINPSIYFYR